MEHLREYDSLLDCKYLLRTDKIVLFPLVKLSSGLHMSCKTNDFFQAKKVGREVLSRGEG